MFVVRAIVTLLVSTTLAVRGYRKQSLDFSGSVAGFITALISMGECGASNAAGRTLTAFAREQAQRTV